ncbi:DUF637 domain-containing protein [Pseudomonas sp.]|uniref:two-partner secretion domain-containing protein n=1 Tax=Pseudomonas sp. TaxID=306 RepID=UPI003D1058FB
MDVRSPFFQSVASVLIGILFLNPIVSTAAELALDAAAGGNAALTQAQNGVPMVNIATPNGSGLSHNKFTDYNVGQQGLILNNSAQNLVQSQLGGYVLGNPNLAGGAANLILNEVNGGNPSQLRGYTEVAGKSAHVIVANPHGITCDGCGFINTPRVTLSTGKPLLEGGQLKAYDVEGGQIAIEGQGLNARNVDQFDLITRSAQVNAEIHAQKLTVTTGRNQVDAGTLAATAKADDGSEKPQLAIDSSALGGMYAGAIRLVGTEAGVGVKLAGDMAASAGDIQIDANGKLSLARVAASNDLELAAADIELNGDTFAGRSATVASTGETLVKESLAAGNRVEVRGGSLNNQGSIEAGVRADASLNTAAHLQLGSETLTNRGEITSHGTLSADVKQLDNAGSTIVSAGDASLQAEVLDNQGGRIVAQQTLSLTGGDMLNQSGEILAQQGLTAVVANLDNQGGTLAANAVALTVDDTLNNQQGLIEAATDLQVQADTLDNADGRLRALGSIGQSRFALGSRFNNDAGLVEIGNAAFALTAADLSNQGGTVRHAGNQGFDLALDSLGQAGGSFITNGEMSLTADTWTNTSSLQADRLSLDIGDFTQTASGALLSRQSIVATGDTWRNDGRIETDGDLDLTLTGAYTGNGALLTQGELTFDAASTDLGADAEVRSAKQAEVTVQGELINLGKLTAGGWLNLAADSLNNQGTLGAAGDLLFEAESIRNENGLIFSGTDMRLRSDSLSNLYGDIYSLGSLDIAADEEGTRLSLLENRSGSIESADDMSLRAATLTNRKEVFRPGREQTYGGIGIVCYDCSGDHHNVDYVATERFVITVDEDSSAARIHSGGDLNVQGGSIANQFSSISASGDIQIHAVNLENTGAASGTIDRVRRFNTGRVTDGTDERFRGNYINPYNANPLPKEVPGALYGFNLVSDIETMTPDGSGSPAIIQAGGNVDIQASQDLDNSSILTGQVLPPGQEQALETTVSTTPQPVVVQLNAQLPPDLAQQAVDPLGLPGFSLPTTQNGLFQRTDNPDHPYLVETNPEFASLGGFLNSGYLLDAVGYDPELNQRRLGDGLYEQRLIQQAVAARTGKRFLDGLTSDEAQFRYLMDNAIVSKNALNLAPGVALSAEQIAALTHDIVWMQEQVVDGQRVLVPVLYLAQANDRLAPGGALIQGQDVALISGSGLSNSGTLRASHDLSVTAGNIGNSGLMQASQRLQLLATDSIRNAQGGIINGQNVSASALAGDITNERSISQEARSGRGFSQLNSVVDGAARIEASGDLSLSAGNDLRNIGGALQVGGNADLSAGNDVVIGSAAAENGLMRQDKRHFISNTSTTQYGSDVQVGGNLAVQAGNDLAVIASTIKAEGDISLLAEGDTTIASAANESSSEYRYKRSGKKINKEESSSRQQASIIEAGGDLDIAAKGNLALSASQLKAGDEAFLYAGEQLALLSAQNSDYYLYDMKKKGSWGSKKTQRDEVTTIRNIGSTITTGGDLTLVSEGDQLYQRSRLESGNDLTLNSGGAITFEAVKDLDQESHEKSSSSLAWTSAKGKGTTDETLLQSQMIAKGNLVIQAVDGLKIDVKQVDQQSVSQTINAMVAADPDLAWIKEAESRGDVDWRQVKEIHDSFKYSHSGLGAGAQLVIAIVVSYLTIGMGAALTGATSAGGIAASNVVFTAAANNAAVSVINNRGNLGAVFKDVTSSDALKGYATSALTAGLTAGVLDSAFGVTGDNVNKVTKGFDLSKPAELAKFGSYLGIQGGIQAAAQTALQGGSLGDNLQNALTNQVQHLLQAGAFNAVGDFAGGEWVEGIKWDDGSPGKVALHAVVGGLLSEATGGDFKTGALTAGLNEALIERLSGVIKGDKNLELAVSQLIGVAAASATGGDMAKAAELAKNATAYNRQLHEDQIKIIQELSDDPEKQNQLKAVLCVIQYCDINGLSGYDAKGEAIYKAGLELKANNPELFAQLRSEINSAGLLSGQFAYKPGGSDFTKDLLGREWNDKLRAVGKTYDSATRKPDDWSDVAKGFVKGLANNVKGGPQYPLDSTDENQGAILANTALVVGPAAAAGVRATASSLSKTADAKATGATPNFYTSASGETIPAAGYRYVSSDAPYLQDLLSHGTIPANSRGTYISFDQLGQGAAGKLQVPHDAAIRIEFDTKQILGDVQIPKGQWGKADYSEPITSDFPQFGPGGATQAVTTKPIVVNKIIDARTGKVLYERGQ